MASANARMPRPEVFSERKSSSMITMGKRKRCMSDSRGTVGRARSVGLFDDDAAHAVGLRTRVAKGRGFRFVARVQPGEGLSLKAHPRISSGLRTSNAANTRPTLRRSDDRSLNG